VLAWQGRTPPAHIAKAGKAIASWWKQVVPPPETHVEVIYGESGTPEQVSEYIKLAWEERSAKQRTAADYLMQVASHSHHAREALAREGGIE